MTRPSYQDGPTQTWSSGVLGERDVKRQLVPIQQPCSKNQVPVVTAQAQGLPSAWKSEAAHLGPGCLQVQPGRVWAVGVESRPGAWGFVLGICLGISLAWGLDRLGRGGLQLVPPIWGTWCPCTCLRVNHGSMSGM